jgi:hypothetical protein
MRTRLLNFLRQRLGLDRAIAASSATQMMRFITGPVTMLLIIRFLTPEEQGFFYSFAGVVGIQVFLEAGFAQSISQFSSKEFALLRFNRDGLLTGSPAALSRIRSIFHKANRYYTAMAAVLTLALAGGGYWFFSSKPDYGVPWMVPWFVVSVCAGIGFLLTPFWALLEGCNRVVEVAVYRFWATMIGFATSATFLALGFGIHVSLWTSVITILFPIIYLALRWPRLIRQILRPPGKDQVSWGKDIWGFQWRIASSWICRYFLESGISPLAMHLGGAVIAGQTGMTLQVLRLVAQIGNSWTVLKVPIWGSMISSGKWREFNSSWKLAAKRNVIFRFTGITSIFIVIALLGTVWPAASQRFLPLLSTAGFAIGLVLYSFFLISSHYTRAMRIEPYTVLHIFVAISFIGLAFMTCKWIGDYSIPWSFAIVHIPAAFIAMRTRSIISRTHTPMPC